MADAGEADVRPAPTTTKLAIRFFGLIFEVIIPSAKSNGG